MTIKEAAKTAILAQDACNLSGVLASFHNVVTDVIWPEARRLGKATEFVNTHPIVTLFLDKLKIPEITTQSLWSDLRLLRRCAKACGLAQRRQARF